MPQLDFREALSAPNEKLFSSPESVAAPSAAPSAATKTNVFARGVQFSRSTWANIFFVMVASVGGLACAFYFFNGGDLLRAAAAWPNEFLYPRPLSTEKIDIGAQLNAGDQFANNEPGSTETDETRNPVAKNVGPSDFSQPASRIGASNATVTAPAGSGTTLLPTTPVLPAAPSVPGGVEVPSVPSTDSVFQSLSQTAASITPTKITTRTGSTRSSSRRKALRSQPKVAGPTKSATSIGQSTIQQMQQTSIQTQAPLNGIQTPTQMTMGGGLGVAPGGAVGGVGSTLGGAGGGLGGTIGGIVGGHH